MRKLGKDLRLRVLSVFIALILWAYVINIQNPEIKVDFENIPIEITNLGSLDEHSLVWINKQSFITSVKVKGKKEAVGRLSRFNIKAVVDVKNYSRGTGKISIPVNYNIIDAPGVQVVEGKQKEIQLNLEKLIQVQKRVDTVIQGDNKADAKYEVKSIVPNVVTISGPENLIKSIDSVKAFVDVSNQEKDIYISPKCRVIDKSKADITDSQGLTSDIQRVQVHVAYSKVKEVPITTKFTGQAAKGYYISDVTITPKKVYIIGQPGKIENIEKIEAKRISISGINKDLEKELPLTIPLGVRVSFSSVKVNIDIKKEQEKTLDIQASDINIAHNMEGYLYEILTSNPKVQIIGRDVNLDTVQIGSLGMYINVNGLKPGEYWLPISINLQDNIRLGGENSTVKVKITEKKNEG